MKPTEYLVEAAGFADSIWLKAKGERIELDHGTPVVLASECEEAIAAERKLWEEATFLACAGTIATPEKPTKTPCTRQHLRDLRIAINRMRMRLDHFEEHHPPT